MKIKQRIGDIINKLQLSKRDKNDLTKYFEESGKSEIPNIPANFLNNNNELGGIVNMPFGYNGTTLVDCGKIDGKEGEYNLGRIENFFYPYIVIINIDDNNYRRISDVSKNDIIGYENRININGPVTAHLNENLELIITYVTDYISLNISYSTYSSKNKLSSEWVDIEASTTTPDWDAAEGKEGYIENRTHWIIPANYTIDKNNIEIPYSLSILYCKIGPSIKELPKLNIGDKYYVSYGPPVYLECVQKYNGNYLVLNDPTGYINSIKKISFYESSGNPCQQLSPYFIPQEIARVADYELPHITFYTQDYESNLTLLQSLNQGDKYVCDVYDTEKWHNDVILQNGEYYNGTITGICNGNFVKYTVNTETGELSLKCNIDIEDLYNRFNEITIQD